MKIAGLAGQLARLAERPDAGAALERLAPLETRVGALEARPWDPAAEEARAGTQAIAAPQPKVWKPRSDGWMVTVRISRSCGTARRAAGPPRRHAAPFDASSAWK